MSRYQQLLAELKDPAKYRMVPGVAIFDAHVERRNGKVVRRFGKKELEEIASRCNAREKKRATLSPIAIGHTDPEEPDEKKQPEGVGYARNYRVGYDRDLNNWVIQADYYIRQDRYKEARTYPRTSIELWAEDRIIDPIALLRRTPKRDLGQWTYAREQNGKTIIRYSMGGHSMPFPAEEEDTGALPPQEEEIEQEDAADASMAEEETHEPSHEEKVDQFMKHCFSHPHAKYMASHYGMEEGGGEEEEAPEAFSAQASATNAAIPGSEEEKEVASYGKGDKANVPVAYARLSKAGQKAVREESKRLLADLDNKGVLFDGTEEFHHMINLPSSKERVAYAKHMAKRYARAPIGRTGRVNLEETSSPDDEIRLGEKALAYQKANGFKVSYEDALRAVRKNGVVRN